MSKEPIFRIFDTKYKKWMNVRGENGRTFDQYRREKYFKKSGLMWCDMEGFSIDEYGYPMLNDECGGSLGLDPKRFQVCLDKKILRKLKNSKPGGNYKIL